MDLPNDKTNIERCHTCDTSIFWYIINATDYHHFCSFPSSTDLPALTYKRWKHNGLQACKVTLKANNPTCIKSKKEKHFPESAMPKNLRRSWRNWIVLFNLKPKVVFRDQKVE